MSRSIQTVIDPGLCNGCELCVEVCPSDALSMRDGVAVVTGDTSLGCGHCVAICPTDAVTIGFVDDRALDLATVVLPPATRDSPPVETGALVRLMRARRSCRHFADDPVDRGVLEDLVKIGTTAPSGTNCQMWTFTVLPTRQAVAALGGAVGDFFRRLNRMSESRVARLYARLFLKDRLGEYFREYHDKVVDALREFDETGRDRLFHGAPAVIAIGSERGASCPSEDALLASQNILLAAEAMGLGTCLIGFAVEAMRNDPSIKARIGIPAGEPVYAVIAIGHPRYRYPRPAGRRRVEPRWFEGGPGPT